MNISLCDFIILYRGGSCLVLEVQSWLSGELNPFGHAGVIIARHLLDICDGLLQTAAGVSFELVLGPQDDALHAFDLLTQEMILGC